MDKNELNLGHYHEVMDRASMMVEIWASQVRDLGVTQAEPRLREGAKRVAQALVDFYQLAGAVHSEMEDED